MPGFTESSITLNFPDNNFFRFADCGGYRQLARFNFKEMDACWYDAANNLYWLIELKDFSVADISVPANLEQRAWDIAKKAYDTICMFLSVKHNYSYSASILPCIPMVPNDETKWKLVTIIHSNNSQKADIQLLNNSFRNKFKPYAELFGIEHYSVVEHTKAIAFIPKNIVQ